MLTNKQRDLGIAALCVASGLLSAFLAVRGRADAGAAMHAATLDVVVAARDLDGAKPLNAETDLATRRILVLDGEPTLQTLVKASDRAALAGQSLVAPIQKGSVITLSHIVRRPDLQVRSAESRALCLDLGPEALFSGLLMPNDRIDILVSSPKAAPADATPPGGTYSPESSPWRELLPGLLAPAAGDDWQSEVVLEDVRVIAVGADLSGARGAALDPQDRAGRQSITIEVNASEAILLSNRLAVRSAQVRVLLRAPIATDPT